MGIEASVPSISFAGTGTVADYFSLLKPRVMTLVVFTGIVGMSLAPSHLHPVLALAAILSIAVGAGASGAINMWYERDVDAIMRRTQNRPLPQGRIDPDEALTFGVVLTLFQSCCSALPPIGWRLFGWRWLRLFMFLSIQFGSSAAPHKISSLAARRALFLLSLAGRAVTGTTPVEAWLLFALIFFWTPPHFWALALYRSEDYARAGIPMLPVVKGKEHTRWQMLAYTLFLLPLSLAPVYIGLSGLVYGVVAAGMSLVFIGHAVRVLHRKDDASAKAMFLFSLLYLATLFAALLVDRGLG